MAQQALELAESLRLRECIQCGLCTIRCPAEIPHYHVFQLARRLYGKYMVPRAEHLTQRIKEIEEGKFDEEMEKLMKMSIEELKRAYENRGRVEE